MPRKKRSSRRSYSRKDSYSDGESSADSRYSREASQSRDRNHSPRRDRRYRKERNSSRDDRYRREPSSSRDRYHREPSASRDRYRREPSSSRDRYHREPSASRDRYHHRDDHSDGDQQPRRSHRRSSGSYGSRRSASRYETNNNNDDDDASDYEEYERKERSRARNEERRARKAGRRPKAKMGVGRGGVPVAQAANLTMAAQKRRNNNHNTNGNSSGIDNMKLKATLEGEGLSIVDMSSDGNCLFRSLSDQLYNDRGHHHDEVRSDICDFMAENEDEFKMFLVFEGDGKNSQDATDFESYIADTRRDGVWGGNLELVAAARMYGRNITVYSATLAVFTIDCDCEEPCGPNMLLSFHSGDHYNSVRQNAGNGGNSKNKKGKISRGSSRKLSSYASGGSSRRSLSDTATTSSTISNSPPTDGLQDTNIVVATVVGIDDVPTVKKNDPCPCGSGRRYKRCCWANVKEEKKEERRRRDRKNRGYSQDSHDLQSGSNSKDRDDEGAVSGFKVLQI